MYKKTFKILDENPKLFFWFSIPAIVLFLSMLILFISLYFSAGMENKADFMLAENFSDALVKLCVAVYLASSVFLYPYVYSMVNNIYKGSGKINYAESLKRNWHRLLLTIVIAIVLFFVFFVLITLLMAADFSFIISIILLLIITIAIFIYCHLSCINVIYEKTWRAGIARIFKKSGNIFFRTFLSNIIFGLPIAIVIIAQIKYKIPNVASADVLRADISFVSVLVSLFFLLFVLAANVFRDAFVTVFIFDSIYKEQEKNKEAMGVTEMIGESETKQ